MKSKKQMGRERARKREEENDGRLSDKVVLIAIISIVSITALFINGIYHIDEDSAGLLDLAYVVWITEGIFLFLVFSGVVKAYAKDEGWIKSVLVCKMSSLVTAGLSWVMLYGILYINYQAIYKSIVNEETLEEILVIIGGAIFILINYYLARRLSK